MALDISPPNYAALAALAGNQYKSQMPEYIQLANQAAQIQMQDEDARRQALLEQMQIQQQGQLGLLQNGTNQQEIEQRGLLGQQQVQQQAAEAQGLADYRNQQLQLDQSKLSQDEQQNQLDRQATEKGMQLKMYEHISKLAADTDKDALARKGAYAAYTKQSLDSAATPEEAQMKRIELIKSGVSEGIISKEEGEIASRMPLSQFKQAAEFHGMIYGTAAQQKALMDKEQPGEISIVRHSDGSVEFTSNPSKPTTNALQKDAVGIEKQLNNLDMLEQKLDKRYLTWRGKATSGSTELAEKAEGIPILAEALNKGSDFISGMDKEERTTYLRDMQGFANQTFQVFQDYRMRTTGMQAAYAELKETQDKYLSGDMSFNQYVGAISGLKQKYKSDLELIKKQLSGGIDVTPKSLSSMTYEELQDAYKSLRKN